MKQDQAIYLVVGIAFGTLLGFMLFTAWSDRPLNENQSAFAGQTPPPTGPAGPPAADAAGGGAFPMQQMLQELKQKLDANPDDDAALSQLASLYARANMWPEADRYFDRVVELRPDLKPQLANFYHDAERWDRAIEFYTQAIAAAPRDPNLKVDMGICYKRLGEFDRALELFGEASEIQDDHWQALFNTVIVAGFDLGRYEQAEAAMARLEQMRPGETDVQRLRERLDAARNGDAG
ncbi:hypothetical protein ABI59_06085 [Acidobacteria bacterium Mor1]|nr:hypothetical protein ABI59_06085 [Acidobacteria bacterium Mor1]